MTLSKIAPSDIERYPWSWWEKYGERVIEELTSAFTASIFAQFPDLNPLQAQQMAVKYAQERGASLLRIDGTVNIVETTKARVRTLTAQALENGDSVKTLAKAIREDPIFSRVRAETIARTETAEALGQGTKGAAVAQGRDEKSWITQMDERVDAGSASQPCILNEAQGWIKIGDAFQSGHEQIPAHPRCRCNTLYRTAALAGLEEELLTEGVALSEVRCPTCDYRLPVNSLKGSADFYCKRCNKGFEVRS